MNELVRLLLYIGLFVIIARKSHCGRIADDFVRQKIYGWNKSTNQPSPKEVEQFNKDILPILLAYYTPEDLSCFLLTGANFDTVALRVYDTQKFLSTCKRLGISQKDLETPLKVGKRKYQTYFAIAFLL